MEDGSAAAQKVTEITKKSRNRGIFHSLSRGMAEKNKWVYVGLCGFMRVEQSNAETLKEHDHWPDGPLGRACPNRDDS